MAKKPRDYGEEDMPGFLTSRFGDWYADQNREAVRRRPRADHGGYTLLPIPAPGQWGDSTRQPPPPRGLSYDQSAAFGHGLLDPSAGKDALARKLAELRLMAAKRARPVLWDKAHASSTNSRLRELSRGGVIPLPPELFGGQ